MGNSKLVPPSHFTRFCLYMLLSFFFIFHAFFSYHHFTSVTITLPLCVKPRTPLLFLHPSTLDPILHSQTSIEVSTTTSLAEIYMSKSTIPFSEYIVTSSFANHSSGATFYEETL